MIEHSEGQENLSPWVNRLPFLLMAPLLLGLPASCVFQNPLELYPDHSGTIASGSLSVAALAGALAIFLVLRFKPPLRKPRAMAAIAMGITAAFGTGMLSATIIDKVRQYIDFSSQPIIETEGYFLIDRAYVSHGKGSHYHIQLRTYFADIGLKKRDYVALFGKSDDERPIGSCIKLPLQRSGADLRILLPLIGYIRRPQVGPCPKDASLI